MYDLNFMALVIATIILLPWSQKHSGLWNKLQKWYKYLVAGLLLALVPMVLSYYTLSGITETTSFLIGYVIQPLFETLAIISGLIGVLGMCKSLLFE